MEIIELIALEGIYSGKNMSRYVITSEISTSLVVINHNNPNRNDLLLNDEQ